MATQAPRRVAVPKRARLFAMLAATLPILGVCGATIGAEATPPGHSDGPVQTEKARVRLETVVGGLEHPWGIAFFPDGRALITERPGRLRMLGKDGKPGNPITGIPPLYTAGQGGLLDVAIDPDFARNRLVFF